MMSRHILILIFIISLIVPNGYAQNLLSVEWQKNVCTNDYISHVYSVCNDNDGNTYTLGSFSNEANSLGENRSEEHTSELQSRPHLVCRLLLEKKNMNIHLK